MEENTYKNLDGIEHTEDSGFASIAGSSDNGKPNNNLISDDIKFSSVPIPTDTKLTRKRIRSREVAEAKRKAEEEYNNERQELIYKRLKHLVSKSKFFSNHIINKANNLNKSNSSKNKNIGNGRGKTQKQPIQAEETDEFSPPVKKSKRITRGNCKYDIKDYITEDIKKKQISKLSLSQDDIENELNHDSDEESHDNVEVQEDIALKYFIGELRDYQKKGLKWLITLYENGLNGILADEMGLGKTIQVIALMCYLIEKEQPGPFLIITPLSTIPNWMMEFERFAPDLPVVLLHGPSEAREIAAKKMKTTATLPDGYQTLPIIVTTYEIPFREAGRLRRCNWRHIIIDEGHRIKNHKAQLSRIVRTFTSISRLILTGTPLQNNLAELWALLNFLMPDIFDDLDVFESWFDAKELQDVKGIERFLQQEKDKQVIASLREILKPFMLRREKTEVCTEIPDKKEIIVYTPITELQRDLYVAVLNRDYDSIAMKKQEPAIIDDVNGVRPKRKCTLNNKYSSNYTNPFAMFDKKTFSSSSSPLSINNNEQYNRQAVEHSLNKISDRPKTDDEQKLLDTWQKFTDIDDRNVEYFIRIRAAHRTPIYKQIINHPYLIHCPLDDSGLPKIDENLVKASGKLLVLDLMLKKLYSRGHKVLLFSTMLMVLNLIADYLQMRPWKFVMLNGTINIDERCERIKQFNNDPDIFLFLITTRAGGVGLNLTAADTVILYDSDWNSQVDLQAMARCHRIGQTKPVMIYRLCTKGTIDETIINRAEAKRKLEKMVISKKWGDSNSNKVGTIMELKQLLESTEYKIVRSESDVFTEAELDALLDRSDLMPKPTKQETD